MHGFGSILMIKTCKNRELLTKNNKEQDYRVGFDELELSLTTLSLEFLEKKGLGRKMKLGKMNKIF